MSIVFADTHYFIALVNPRDQSHSKAVEWAMASTDRILTTTWVLIEFGNHASKSYRKQFLDFYADLKASAEVEIVPPDQRLFDLGLARYAARSDKEWSLTDCISFVVMEERGVTDALTGDRHFEQAGFNILLK